MRVCATDGNRTSGIGLYHSSDFGDSMRPVEPAEGLPAAAVADLAVDPSNAYLIYAGVPGEGIFKRSRDGIWNAVNTGLSGFERASRIELAVSKSLDPNSRTHPVYAALIGEITDYTIGTNAGDDFFFVGSNTLLQPGDTVTISDSEFPFLQESRLILSIERDGDRCKVTLDAPLHHSIGGTVTSVADLTVSGQRLSGVFRSAYQGSNWVSMDLPGTDETTGFFGIHLGARGDKHFSMAADPYMLNVVYVGGTIHLFIEPLDW